MLSLLDLDICSVMSHFYGRRIQNRFHRLRMAQASPQFSIHCSSFVCTRQTRLLRRTIDTTACPIAGFLVLHVQLLLPSSHLPHGSPPSYTLIQPCMVGQFYSIYRTALDLGTVCRLETSGRMTWRYEIGLVCFYLLFVQVICMRLIYAQSLVRSPTFDLGSPT